MDGEQAEQWRRRADGHQPCEAQPLQQRQAERPAHGKRAIHGHSRERHDLAGPRLTHKADGPAEHAHHRQTFAEPQQQTSNNQHDIVARDGQTGPTGQKTNQPGRGIHDQAAPHADLAAEPVGQRSGMIARQDR